MTSTTAGSITQPTELGRCALCKIDLRGRFVFIDDETERILGRPREELFGQYITDILDRNSRPIIERLLADRNHYESHFDYAELTVTAGDGRPIAVEATMSLCFHGGNPVNFQLILKPAAVPTRTIEENHTGLPVEQFLESFLALSPDNDRRALAELLQEFTGAEQVAIYLFSGGELEPRSGASANGDGCFLFDTIPECTDLHLRIARTGGEYAVAAEQDDARPPEFVAAVRLADGGTYLLRFLFSLRLAEDVLERGLDRARLARMMIEHLAQAPLPESDPEDPDIDVKFTIGFLSSLGIGAFLTDAAGEIVGYNPALAEMLGEVDLGPSYHDFIALLDADGSRGLAELIDQCPGENEDGDLRIHINLPSGQPCLLSIVQLARDDEDRSACWVLMPQNNPEQPVTADNDAQPAWQPLMQGMKPVLDEVTDGAEQLSRDYCRQVGELDDHQLSRLHDAIRTLGEMNDYGSLLQTCSAPGDIAPVDLNELVDNALQQLRSEHSDLVITCDHDDLPAIKSSHGRLSAVLRNLMTNCVRHNSHKEVSLKVTASIRGNECQITLLDRNLQLPRAEHKRLLDFYLPPVIDGKKRQRGGLGLGLSRELLRSLGGSLKTTAKRDGGTRLAISLPLTSRQRG